MGRNLENLYHRYLHGGVEMVEVHHNGADTFMRAIPEVKSRGEAAYVTRNNGIKRLKTFGGSPVKHKADKLWGRYVPAVASDTTLYPMVLENLLDPSAIRLGYGYRVASGTASSNAGFSSTNKISVEPNTSYSTNFNVGSNGTFGLCFYKSDETFISGKSLSSGFATFTTPSECYSVIATTQENPPASGKYLYKGNGATYVPFGGKWVFVKDIGSNGAGTDFGYYNDATNEFVKVVGASGTVIQSVEYLDVNKSQYCLIDNVIFSNNTELEAEIFVDSYPANVDGVVVGARFGSDYVEMRAATSSEAMSGAIQKFGDATARIPGMEGRHTITINSSGANKDSTHYNFDTTPSTFSHTGKLGIFCGYNNSELTSYSKVKVRLYSLVKRESGVIDLNIIPVRIGTVGYLLDTNNWTLHAEAGGATPFVYGADIPYSQLVPDVIEVNTGDIKYGRYSSNLWNYENTFSGTTKTVRGITFTKQNDGGIKCTGTATSQAYTTPYEMINDLEVGKTYRIATFGNLNPKANFQVLKNGSSSYPNVYTVDGTEEKIEAYFYINEGDTVDGTVYLMISEGSAIPTEYEPYHFGIFTEGSHKLIVGGKNLVVPSLHTADGLTEELAPDGRIHIYGTCTRTTAGFGVGSYNLPAGTYTLSCSISGSYGNITSITFNTMTSVPLGETRTVSKSSPATSSAGIAIENGVQYDFYITPQIEEGSQATPYEPYIAPQIRDIPMLLSEDSYLDTQLSSNNKTEYWGIHVYDGVNLKALSKQGNAWILNGSGKVSAKTEIICSHFPYSTGTSSTLENHTCISFNSYQYGFRADEFSTADDVNAWLASEYAKGTPVIILYPLATPATEQVTITPVASQRRTTYVADSDSELGKLNLSMEYLGKYGIPQPADEIWYTTTDGNIVEPWGPPQEGLTVVSNTYADGKGVIKMSGNITSISNHVFSQCENLATITLPDTVTTIGNRVFEMDDNLTSITLPRSLTSIGHSAFSDCTSLRSITLPATVTTIGDTAFQYCSGLASITCLATTPPAVYASFYGSDCPIYVPAESVDTYKAATNWRVYENRILAIQ